MEGGVNLLPALAQLVYKSDKRAFTTHRCCLQFDWHIKVCQAFDRPGRFHRVRSGTGNNIDTGVELVSTSPIASLTLTLTLGLRPGSRQDRLYACE